MTTYTKVFPAELDCLYDMLSFIKEYISLRQPASSFLEQVILATEEALVNVINYGYPDDKRGTIEITCEDVAQPAGVKITVKDQGIPFNPVENAPSTLPSPSSIIDKAHTSLGGYGIYILVGIMDRVEYERFNGGNLLVLTKYL